MPCVQFHIKRRCKRLRFFTHLIQINFGIDSIELKQVNPGQVGFYRVCYDKETVEKFVPAIKDMSLPPLDRVGIQNDQFALVIVKSYLLINQ